MRMPSRTVALSALLLLAAGCAGGAGHDDGQAKMVPTAKGTVEQLAAKARCTPNMQIKAGDVRQGVCSTRHGRYVLASFTTNQGQQAWLGEAQPYGGWYLVGRKWVAVGHLDVLRTLRRTLGGQVEAGPSHSGHAQSGHAHSGDGHGGDGHGGDGGHGGGGHDMGSMHKGH